MRIALLHSFYSSAQSSGENVVVQAQAESLRRAGNDVLLLGRHTDDEERRSGHKVRVAWQTVTNAGPDPSGRLRDFAPDIIHIHNTVPNIGTRWVARWPGPIVHTLHNFRPLCANGLLFRDGALCTECPDGRPWAAVEHGCYRNSRVATLPIATRNSLGLESNPLLRRADAFVVLSEYARSTFARYGLPSERLHLVPNGVRAVHGAASRAPGRPRWLAIGRLRDEKGFAELLRGWPAGAELDIIGDGPQADDLAELAGPQVHLLGALPADEVRALLPSYSCLVFASLAPESAMPLVVVEALEAGIPVLIVSSSPHAQALVDAYVATTFDIVDGSVDTASLSDAMDWVAYGGAPLRDRCREHYRAHYTEDDWLREIVHLYERTIAAPRRPQQQGEFDAS